MKHLPAAVPVMVLGACLQRDHPRRRHSPAWWCGLGKSFGDIAIDPGTASAPAPACWTYGVVPRGARRPGIAGLEFYSGIPGGIGGALRMNGGAYGGETKDVLVEARGVDRAGNVRTSATPTWLHLSALRRAGGLHLHAGAVSGRPGDPAAIAAEMDKITRVARGDQPIKSRTGGSTFKNPPAHKAWQLIDAAGCRGSSSAARRSRSCTATS
jgi:UDP-N-acetylmuramate dehydrogenase